MRILAEVDLNHADFYRDTFIKLVWSFDQKKSPYQILPHRGINVKHFFNTLSDRLAQVRSAFCRIMEEDYEIPMLTFLNAPSYPTETDQTGTQKKEHTRFGNSIHK